MLLMIIHAMKRRKSTLKTGRWGKLIRFRTGFWVFAFALMVINVQFLPIIAKPKENEVLFNTYDIAKTTQNKVALLYQQTRQCPVDLPLDIDEQQVRIKISTQAVGAPKTDCAVLATIQKVKFPIRYLNDQTLMFYHNVDDNSWRCTSSLNKNKRLHTVLTIKF